MPEDIVIEGSSIPHDLDVFHARDFATLILATEKFVEKVLAFSLTDILTKEVKVVNAL